MLLHIFERIQITHGTIIGLLVEILTRTQGNVVQNLLITDMEHLADIEDILISHILARLINSNIRKSPPPSRMAGTIFVTPRRCLLQRLNSQSSWRIGDDHPGIRRRAGVALSVLTEIRPIAVKSADGEEIYGEAFFAGFV